MYSERVSRPLNYPLPGPHPELSPDQVIEIQLEALQNNDTPRSDIGIEIAYNFASPDNKAYVGPIERFILMVKNPLYRSMLNFKTVHYGPLNVEGNQARQRVVITGARGERIAYTFALTRQNGGRYAGCWMTDSVLKK